MHENIIHGWTFLIILVVLSVILAAIMMRQGKKFYTKDPVRKSFTMLSLEFPGSAQEIYNLVQGIYKLPDDESVQVLRALRSQLVTDFLFMPVAYGGIHVLNHQVYLLMPSGEGNFFLVLAWLQVVPWICDIVENLFLFGRIGKDARVCSPGVFTGYRILEYLKWGISLFGVTCGVSSLFYLWLTGHIG